MSLFVLLVPINTSTTTLINLWGKRRNLVTRNLVKIRTNYHGFRVTVTRTPGQNDPELDQAPLGPGIPGP